MASYSKIAGHLGISKSMVVKLVKKGMPVRSLTGAEKWRRARVLSRAPTNGQRMLVKATPRKPGRLRKTASLQASGDSMLDALNQIKYAREAAFELFLDAKNAGDLAAISPLIALHTRTVMTYFKAESAYRAELERRGVLVNKYEITEHCRRCLDAVLKRPKKLPQESGPQCNPGDPLLALKILHRAVDEVIATGRNVLQEL